MAIHKRRKRRQQREEDTDLQAYKAHLRAGNIGTAIRWGGVVLCVFFMSRAVGVLAGETTAANIGVRFFGNLTISQALAWALTAGTVAWGWQQRRLRRNTVERLAKRSEELERSIDPNRSSSALTPRGETNPEDRV